MYSQECGITIDVRRGAKKDRQICQSKMQGSRKDFATQKICGEEEKPADKASNYRKVIAANKAVLRRGEIGRAHV